MTGKSLAIMAGEVFENNTNKGWFDEDRSMGDDAALLHSEVSEMLEAWRDWGTASLNEYVEFLHKEEGTNGATRIQRSSTLAILGSAADTVLGYNQIGKPQGMASEMADILIRLLDSAYRYGVDLEAEYERKMAYNRTRPPRHGGKRV